MDHSPIYSFLQKEIGLDVQSVGVTVLSRAIKNRMQATGMNDEKTYFGSLKNSSVETNELIEQVVIPETWFFRNRESFQFLSRLASEVVGLGDSSPLSRGSLGGGWMNGRRNESVTSPLTSPFIRGENPKSTPLRILSVACASGEEPYSIAMTLIDAGIPVKNFQIDAIDISESAMEKAKQGFYSANSFRGDDLQFRQSYFNKVERGWLLSPEIRKTVRFFQHNFLEVHPVLSQSRYDVIFCRNFLIYLHPEAKSKVLQTLYGLLKQEGTLFVGHSEAGLPLAPLFHIVRPLSAFAHQKNQTKTS